jgi:hypothetical protein
VFRKTEEEKAADEARKQTGQQLFQLLLPLGELNGDSSSFGSSENQLTSFMQAGILDEIEKVGWRLEQADAVFAETGATSSSRVLATGEGTSRAAPFTACTYSAQPETDRGATRLG